jgi:hypothetical protein
MRNSPIGFQKVDEEDEFDNIAKSGKATQDSTGWNGKANRAIDGNENGDYWQ